MSQADASILIVDDEFSVRDSLTHWFRADGFRVGAASNATEALKLIEEGAWDLALVDIRMPGMDGVELQRRLAEVSPETVVIIVTAYGSVETAVQALKQGAFDYITKPIDPDELGRLVQNGLRQRRLARENTQLRTSIDALSGAPEIVGESVPMKRVMDLIRQVGPTNVTVFIRGESGTGKELVARAIHAGGPRRYFPLVPVNCGALPESLLESELFGHEKGAFTGAQYQRKGKIELADGGTLFLDEIGTVSPKTQVDLLRVLETKTFTRVGGTRTVRSDFRVICATNQDLQEMIDAGTFRRDLFFRINVFPIDLPSLRDRRDDIPRLAEHFLKKYASQMEKRVTGISPEALDTLGGHDWPGNVRELENAIERALVVGKHGMLQACDLPFGKTGRADEPAGESLADVERGHIARVLDRCEWNISRAARILQVDRATLYNKIARYGLRK